MSIQRTESLALPVFLAGRLGQIQHLKFHYPLSNMQQVSSLILPIALEIQGRVWGQLRLQCVLEFYLA